MTSGELKSYTYVFLYDRVAITWLWQLQILSDISFIELALKQFENRWAKIALTDCEVNLVQWIITIKFFGKIIKAETKFLKMS